MGTIYGIAEYGNGAVPERQVDALAAALAHRKLDYHLVWQSDSCILGETGTGSSDEDLFIEDLRLVVVIDGRLDNANELADTLALPRSTAQRRIVGALYRTFGAEGFGRLVGDFAFAIFDLESKVLVCSRDHFGVRPLNYATRNGKFAFASEAYALVEAELAGPARDETRIAEYLLQVEPSQDRSFFSDVKRLAPAHTLRVGPGGAGNPEQYWRLEIPNEGHPGDDEAIAQGFLEHFREAVRCRLAGQDKVGAFLSGGLDSTSVAMTARECLVDGGTQAELPVFSAVFRSVPRTNEEHWIDQVVEATAGHRVPLVPYKFEADRVSPVQYLDEIAQVLRQPNSFPNLYYSTELYRHAAETGVSALLSGIDGDTVVSHGFCHLTSLAMLGNESELDGILNGLSRDLYEGYPADRQRRALAKTYLQPAVGLLVRQRQYLKAYRTLQRLRAHYGLGRRAMVREQFVPALFETTWKRAHRARRKPYIRCLQSEYLQSELVRAVAARTAQPPCGSDIEMQHRAVSSSRVTMTFEVNDMIGARAGIECVHPFFDVRLVNYALRVPPHLKISADGTRIVLRRAMRNIVPEGILNRRNKANMGEGLSFAFNTNPDAAWKAINLPRCEVANYWSEAVARRTLRRQLSDPLQSDVEAVLGYLGHAAFENLLREGRKEAGGGVAPPPS